MKKVNKEKKKKHKN